MAEDQSDGRVHTEPEDQQSRNERDKTPNHERYPDAQQAAHDLGTRIGTHGGRGQSAREQADREQCRDDRAEPVPERRICALE